MSNLEKDIKSREEGPVSFPIEEDPGGADCAPQSVEQNGAIGLPRDGLNINQSLVIFLSLVISVNFNTVKAKGLQCKGGNKSISSGFLIIATKLMTFTNFSLKRILKVFFAKKCQIEFILRQKMQIFMNFRTYY